MSVLRGSSNACECHTNGTPDAGIAALQLVGAPRSTSQELRPNVKAVQQKLAEDAQAQYMPHLQDMSTNLHLGAHHAHPPAAGNLAPLLEIMNNADLTIRVNHMQHGADSQAACAELSASNLQKLLNEKSIALEAPSGGTFNLFAANGKSIDHVQFTDAANKSQEVPTTSA